MGGCILLVFFPYALGRQSGGTDTASPIVPPLEVVLPLEVSPSVISLGLAVTHRWDVGKVAEVWALGLVVVIQIRPFVLVPPALCWSVLGVKLVGSVVDFLNVYIPS